MYYYYYYYYYYNYYLLVSVVMLPVSVSYNHIQYVASGVTLIQLARKFVDMPTAVLQACSMFSLCCCIGRIPPLPMFSTVCLSC
jgi:hypothetical protein